MEDIPRCKGNGIMVTPKSAEFEGKSVEDAIEKALKALNVSRETIDVKVVCEEQRGLFGMDGAKSAKIKVKIKEKKA
jgi:spoIIIJ-associated protein